MLYFIIPIFIVCLILCEILLSQWRNREAIIKNLSQTDPLTNLHNRRFFNEQLNLIHTKLSSYIIILVDLDHFKNINDIFGHHFGDEALCEVAKILSAHTRHTDIVARYGGEEFIIALPNTSLKIAQEIAEHCRLAIQNQCLIYEQIDIQLTASFGISSSNQDLQMNKVIHQADLALYQAKQHGRNQVQIYQSTTT